MNLSEEQDRLDSADGEPASYEESVCFWSLIGACLCVAIAVTVAAIRAW